MVRRCRASSIAGSLLGLSALACGSAPEYVEPPPPVVTVAPPVERPVTDYVEMTGTVVAIETVEIRARVEGFLQSVAFEEGDVVAEGALLFTIDPSEYEARVEEAQASRETARASLELAKATLVRLEKAYETRAVSEIEVLESRAKRDVAVASLSSAEATLRRAQLDLDYTQIHSPISGRVGRVVVDPGNLVGAGENTLLTTVLRYDPIYATFNISERDVLALRDAGAAPRDEVDRLKQIREIPVEVARSNESGYPHHGTLQYADLGIDPETGTFGLRAILPNPQPIALLPGIFVRARMPIRVRERALLVSNRAVGQDQSGRYLLVVGEDDVVRVRPVELGAQVDDLRVIEKGIGPGELVVVNGLQRARPGEKVRPEREVAAQPSGSASDAPEEPAEAPTG